jgi:hypothetical protein
MQKPSLFGLLVSMAVIIVMLAGISATASARNADIRFQNGKMSVNLKDTPLIDILSRLEKEKNIQFACNESLLETPISVAFKNLPLEEGLQRILAFLNYSLMFDRHQQVSGITIVGFADDYEPRHPAAMKTMPVAGAARGRAGSNRSAPRLDGSDELPQPDPATASSLAEREEFKIIKNSPPPGSVTTKSDTVLPDPDPEAFKVIKNSPPPGESSPSPKPKPKPASDNFQIIRNAPPPGNG